MAEESTNEETIEVKDLETYIKELSSTNRLERQSAAHALVLVAKDNPDALQEHVEDASNALIDALFRPEAQTRWEALDALNEICLTNPSLVKDGYEGAEASLFDDKSFRVRLSAFRFLCRMSAANAKTSEKVWPILDEAIQCYHGDQGYRGMLEALLEFAQGKASKNVKEALAKRLAFDAENGRGYIGQMSADIIAATKAK